MPDSAPDSPAAWPLLRRLDQVAVAVLTLAALVCLALYWWTHGGARGQMIEIDRATHRTFQFQVDLNAADWPELSPLPGIGENLARRIVESRAVEGPFADHDSLTRVRGIGPKTLEQVKPYLLPIPRGGSVAATIEQ